MDCSLLSEKSNEISENKEKGDHFSIFGNVSITKAENDHSGDIYMIFQKGQSLTHAENRGINHC